MDETLKKKINFEYGKYDIHKQIQYYHKRRNMIPCKVIYFNEKFYLKCMDEETGKFRTYRIDRMKNIKSGEKTNKKAALPKPEGVVLDIFDPEKYIYVMLRVKRALLDDMLEQFGSYANVKDDPDHPNQVQVNVKVGIGRGFYRWALKYGSDLEILSPASVREEFRKMLLHMMSLYET